MAHSGMGCVGIKETSVSSLGAFVVTTRYIACHTGLQPATAVQTEYPDQDDRNCEQIDWWPGISRACRAAPSEPFLA